MALLKVITSDNGIQTTYHRIEDLLLKDFTLICSLGSYVSEEYAQNNLPAFIDSVDFSITLEEEESAGIRQLAYTKLKELPEWSDAVDC